MTLRYFTFFLLFVLFSIIITRYTRSRQPCIDRHYLIDEDTELPTVDELLFQDTMYKIMEISPVTIKDSTGVHFITYTKNGMTIRGDTARLVDFLSRHMLNESRKKAAGVVVIEERDTTHFYYGDTIRIIPRTLYHNAFIRIR